MKENLKNADRTAKFTIGCVLLSTIFMLIFLLCVRYCCKRRSKKVAVEERKDESSSPQKGKGVTKMDEDEGASISSVFVSNPYEDEKVSGKESGSN